MLFGSIILGFVHRHTFVENSFPTMSISKHTWTALFSTHLPTTDHDACVAVSRNPTG